MTVTVSVLDRSRSTVVPELQAAVARLDPGSSVPASYHFGWCDPEGNPTPGGFGGKAMRPAFALLSAEAVGASAGTGLPGAVAVELVHNFSLIHDDLLDGDVERRHRKTVWAIWGAATAILTGDALLALAHEIVLEADSPTAARAGLLLASTTRELTRGQTQDLAFETRQGVTLDECLDMAGGKTGSLLAASSAIGAVLAGADATTIAALTSFGAQVGLAFQLVDDVLGIWGDPAVTGKSIHSDLRARKKSLPVTWAQTNEVYGPQIRAFLTDAGEPDAAAMDRIADTLDDAGARTWALGEAARRMEIAESTLSTVDLNAAGPSRPDLAREIRGGARLMTLTTQRPTAEPGDVREAASDTLARAVAYLREQQHAAGYWKGELATNVTMDAEDLLLREFLGIRTAQVTEEAARWIRSQQQADGTWAQFHGGPPELSTTVEAWVALRLAGDPADAPHMAKTAAYVRNHGGVASTRVFTRIWLALFGLWSWDELPELPPELIFLPRWFPLNIYDFGCWARQTIVPLTIVGSHKPVRSLPFGIDELDGRAYPRPKAPWWSWTAFFRGLDWLLHLYARRPIGPVRRLAKRRAEAWILARQEADGGWGGIQPPWVYSLIALHLLGRPLDDPVVANGIAGLDGFTIREKTHQGWVRRMEACQSPVWDTALALTAMLDAGVPTDDPDVLTATDWLLAEEIRVPGDWSVRRPKLAPGGWAFEFANDGYPDTDDTAEIVLALRRIAYPDRARLRGAVDRGVDWMIGMQSRDGGWGAFDADNTRTLPTKLPFCDFGEVIDPPSADVTAHIVEALAAEGLAGSAAARRGVEWLFRAQEADGSWFGRWGANYVYGTGAGVPALIAAGIDRADPRIRQAVRWLVGHQNADGGWGEDLRSYVDLSWSGRGTSTPSQTAWALLALMAAGESGTAVDRGVAFLVDTQRPDGGWDEDQFTGTGFPGAFYINYHLYRVVFPVSALGRFVAANA